MLYVTEEHWDLKEPTPVIIHKHNPKIDYVCYCSDPNCRGYGTRSQYGRDYICNECGKPLDWSKEKEW